MIIPELSVVKISTSRVASTILRLAEQIGTRLKDKEIAVEPPLSRPDIAEADLHELSRHT